MSKHEDSIKDGAQGLLDPGEEIASALIVSPRGSGTAVAGALLPVKSGRGGATRTGARRRTPA